MSNIALKADLTTQVESFKLSSNEESDAVVTHMLDAIIEFRTKVALVKKANLCECVEVHTGANNVLLDLHKILNDIYDTVEASIGHEFIRDKQMEDGLIKYRSINRGMLKKPKFLLDASLRVSKIANSISDTRYVIAKLNRDLVEMENDHQEAVDAYKASLSVDFTYEKPTEPEEFTLVEKPTEAQSLHRLYMNKLNYSYSVINTTSLIDPDAVREIYDASVEELDYALEDHADNIDQLKKTLEESVNTAIDCMNTTAKFTV